MSGKELMFFGVSTLSSAMARDENVSCNNLIDCNEFVDNQSCRSTQLSHLFNLVLCAHGFFVSDRSKVLECQQRWSLNKSVQ